jgi:hypothetical protein
MPSIQYPSHQRENQIDPQTDNQVRIQKWVADDPLVCQIEYRGDADGDIQEQADDQAGVVSFFRFNSQRDVCRAGEEGEVRNPEPELVILPCEQSEKWAK